MGIMILSMSRLPWVYHTKYHTVTQKVRNSW